MTTVVYMIWGVVGVVLFNRMAHFHSPWWMYILVIGWGFASGLWSFLSGMDEAARNRAGR